MTLITIREPIWFNNSVGVADKKITSDIIKVRISYKTKDGARLYPDDFLMSKEKAKTYFLAPSKGRLPALRMIPIKDLIESTKELYEDSQSR